MSLNEDCKNKEGMIKWISGISTNDASSRHTYLVLSVLIISIKNMQCAFHLFHLQT